LDEGFRGKNPMGDRGESNNYFKMYGRNSGYDFKRTWMYNALHYLLVECGERSVDDPYGSLTPEEHLAAWVYAKQQGFLPKADKVPNAALNAAAVELGVCEWDDIGPKEVQTRGGETVTIPEAVPDPEYAAVLKQFSDAYGVPPGRSIPVTDADAEIDGLTQENSPRLFAEKFFTTKPRDLPTPFDTPKERAENVWEFYKKVCELNDVEPRSQYDRYSSPKQEIADAVEELEKKSTPWHPEDDGRPQMYVGGRINDLGRDLAVQHGIYFDDWD